MSFPAAIAQRTVNPPIRLTIHRMMPRPTLDKRTGVTYKPFRPDPGPAQVAQSVEQRTENPRVGGSIPPLGTMATHS